MKWRVTAILVSVLLVPSLLLFQPTAQTAQRAAVLGYSIHDPIDIDGNAQFTNASGVVWGSGTPSDPYIIEGWEIDVSGDYAVDGIRIWHTDAHFIVRDVYVSSILTAANGGISLHSVENGSIVNATLENLVVGVACFSLGENLIVEECTFRNCTTGCAVYEAHNITVTSNTFSRNDVGLQFANGDNITASDNSLTMNSALSITLTGMNDSVVVDNHIAKSSGEGVRLGACRNVTLQDNVLESTGQVTYGFGIHVVESTSCKIYNNRITSQNLTADHKALGIDYSSHMQIAGNRIAQVDVMRMAHCNNMSLYLNSFVTSQLPILVNVTGSFWDNGYPSGGNFWSNYEGYDWMSGLAQNVSGPDGIGDTPRQLDLVNVDHYPMMTDSLVPNTSPVASFTIWPMWGDTTVSFSMNASSSSDNQTLFNGVQVRWDFDGNGTWDTSWSTNKTTGHRFAEAGNYTVKLQVRDGGGLTVIAGVNLTVNETEDGGDDLSDFLSDPIVIGVIVAAIVAVVAASVLLLRRKKTK